MRSVFWLLVGCLLGALPVVAFADDYEARIEWRTITVYFPSKQAACDDKVAATQQQYPTAQLRGDVASTGSTVYSWICKVVREDAGDYVMSQSAINPLGYCDGGGTLSPQNGTFMCVGAAACPSGQTRDPVTGQCSVACTSGDVSSSGYYPIGNDPTQALSFPGYACVNGCGAIFDGSAPGARQLVNSKYFYYAKGQYINTGESCSGSTGPAAQGSLPAPSCASGDVMGTRNGELMCASKGTGTVVNPHSPQQGPTTTTTDNGDGTTTTGTNDPNGGGTTTTSGGGGSTTTYQPGIGSDGSGSGGTSGGQYGNDGTGDAQDDDEGGFCDDMPNSAICKEKVPIDEDGTPDNANGVFDAQIQQLNDDSDALKAQISGREWEVSDLGFSWSPGFPSGGSCTPAQFGTKATLDICEPLGKVRDLWAWAFAFLTGLYIWRRGASVQGA